MARLVVALGLLVTTSAVAHAEPTDEMIQVAQEAGVDPVDLEGAVDSTHLGPREYLQSVGELAMPVVPSIPVATAVDRRLSCIASRESQGNPNARNPVSGAAGLFQFLASTWRGTPQGRAGLSPYNPQAAWAAARWMVDQGRIREWAVVQRGYC